MVVSLCHVSGILYSARLSSVSCIISAYACSGDSWHWYIRYPGASSRCFGNSFAHNTGHSIHTNSEFVSTSVTRKLFNSALALCSVVALVCLCVLVASLAIFSPAFTAKP